MKRENLKGGVRSSSLGVTICVGNIDNSNLHVYVVETDMYSLNASSLLSASLGSL